MNPTVLFNGARYPEQLVMSAKVLVAHGNTQHLRQTVQSLQDLGLEVVATPDGGDAFARFFEEMPDLVLCSVALPSLSGPNFARMVRSQSPETPVVLLGSLSQDEEALEGVSTLPDPLHVPHLRELLPELIPEAPASLEEVGSSTASVFIQAALKRFQRDNNLLALMDEKGLQMIAERAEHQVRPPNDLVIRQGDPGDGFYLLVEGQVRVTLEEKQGAEVARINPGGFFGEMALLHDQPRSATVWTVGPTTLLWFDKPSFMPVLESYPVIREVLSGVALKRTEENLWAVLFDEAELDRSLDAIDDDADAIEEMVLTTEEGDGPGESELGDEGDGPGESELGDEGGAPGEGDPTAAASAPEPTSARLAELEERLLQAEARAMEAEKRAAEAAAQVARVTEAAATPGNTSAANAPAANAPAANAPAANAPAGNAPAANTSAGNTTHPHVAASAPPRAATPPWVWVAAALALGLGLGMGMGMMGGSDSTAEVKVAEGTGGDGASETAASKTAAAEPALAPTDADEDGAGEPALAAGDVGADASGESALAAAADADGAEPAIPTAPGALEASPHDEATVAELVAQALEARSPEEVAARKQLRRELMDAAEGGRLQEAIEVGRKLRRTYKVDWQAYWTLAEAERQYGEAAAALASYTHYYGVFPENAFADDARFYAAELLLAQGRTEEARALWEQVAADEGSNLRAAAAEKLTATAPPAVE